MCLIKQYSLKQASCVGLLVRSLLIGRRKQWHVIISIVSVLFGGQLVTSHPSSCYMTLISEQGRVKICKCSQSLFNQFSFSILSLFLRLKTGLNCTRKVVDQRRILNPEFEQRFWRMLPLLSIIYLSISTTTMLRFSSSLYITPTNNEKEID